ncbi:hypothetical protein [Companilactobacillus ginsenosidimutans]|uniref:Uncharacterized protein n=1 Tax=Companilactobacillus ginsenosidimutans TaxID=1007676 RepID=A0A0H4QG79_9LACO|nr:hypothetical protein [Companilactobacillus ginsenosidimutans]AKP67404.1 hypothetical protein ABM34_07555 [Companilactobacillus ginsenosidimutans]
MLTREELIEAAKKANVKISFGHPDVDGKHWNVVDESGKPYANVILPTWEEKQNGDEGSVEFYKDYVKNKKLEKD